MRQKWTSILILMFFVVGVRAVKPPVKKTTQSLSGNWRGMLETTGTGLTVIFHIKAKAGGGLTATMDSPDQGAMGIPVSSIMLEKGKVLLDVPGIGGRYEGTVQNAAAIRGHWMQNGMTFTLNLKRTEGRRVAPPGSRDATALEARARRLVADLAAGSNAAIVSQFDARMQTALPAAKLARVWEQLRSKAGALKKIGATRQVQAGMYRMVLVSCTFALTRLDVKVVYDGTGKVAGLFFVKPHSKATPSPQEPKPPYPYRSEDVTFPNKKADITLAGTLTTPRTGGSFPAVLLISGSGPQDRNETIFGHKPFLVLADYLTRRGIAVLRVDDRGTGLSTGDFATATDDNFVGDALAGLAFLKTRHDINPKEIGLIGHSEGGNIAPRVAVRSKDVAFIVLLEGPGLPGDRIILSQLALILKAHGVPPEKIEAQVTSEKQILAVIKNQPDNAKAAVELRRILSKADPRLKGAALKTQLRGLLSPWYRNFIAYDPRPTLSKVKCSVLAIGGSKDLQVPAKQNLAAIASALKAGGNKDFTVKELPGLNHLLQPAETGAPSGYGTIKTTISPKALKVVGDWILEETKRAVVKRHDTGG